MLAMAVVLVLAFTTSNVVAYDPKPKIPSMAGIWSWLPPTSIKASILRFNADGIWNTPGYTYSWNI
jgi:hypothetical protein